MRRGRSHRAIRNFRLCKEFGWTILQSRKQPSKEIEEFLVILGEIDRLTQEEIDRAKKESQKGFR